MKKRLGNLSFLTNLAFFLTLANVLTTAGVQPESNTPASSEARLDEAVTNLYSATMIGCEGVSGAAILERTTHTNSYGSAEPISGKPYEILLKSRSFAPAEGMGTAIQALLAESAANDSQWIHVLLQLYNMPTPEEVEALATQGIHLLEYIPDKAWLAAVELHRVSQLAGIPSLRWAGPLAPTDQPTR